ncbi:MAG: hypothetical protein M5T61_21235 [Acidimicrobiia bacterium]|nr:hypothetical protein [Acidimicrobiia bacterium]
MPVVLEFVNDGAARHDVTIEGINVIDSPVDAWIRGSQAQSSACPRSHPVPSDWLLTADESVQVTSYPARGEVRLYRSDAGYREQGCAGLSP